MKELNNENENTHDKKKCEYIYHTEVKPEQLLNLQLIFFFIVFTSEEKE